jgi:hypothetical protein
MAPRARVVSGPVSFGGTRRSPLKQNQPGWATRPDNVENPIINIDGKILGFTPGTVYSGNNQAVHGV